MRKEKQKENRGQSVDDGGVKGLAKGTKHGQNIGFIQPQSTNELECFLT